MLNLAKTFFFLALAMGVFFSSVDAASWTCAPKTLVKVAKSWVKRPIKIDWDSDQLPPENSIAWKNFVHQIAKIKEGKEAYAVLKTSKAFPIALSQELFSIYPLEGGFRKSVHDKKLTYFSPNRRAQNSANVDRIYERLQPSIEWIEATVRKGLGRENLGTPLIEIRLSDGSKTETSAWHTDDVYARAIVVLEGAPTKIAREVWRQKEDLPKDFTTDDYFQPERGELLIITGRYFRSSVPLSPLAIHSTPDSVRGLRVVLVLTWYN